MGEIVNFQSIDAQKFRQLAPYLHNLWSSPVQITVAIILLYRYLGVAMLGGVGVMVLMMPLNVLVARRLGKSQVRCVLLFSFSLI